MLLRIAHNTHYSHGAPVSYGLLELRMLPETGEIQEVIRWQVELEGAIEELRFRDQHGNHVMLASYHGEPHEIAIHCEGMVETRDRAGVHGEHRGSAPLWYYRRTTALTRPGPLARALVRELPDGHADGDVGRIHALSALIAGKVAYQTGVTEPDTSAEDALKLGQGVCQDHAHVLITVARLLGFPARYVSGYLMMNDRVEQEASHAWAEVHFDGLGWVGFDVSNAISPDERYVRLASGLDYREAAPIRGMRYASPGDGEDKMLVHIQVQQ